MMLNLLNYAAWMAMRSLICFVRRQKVLITRQSSRWTPHLSMPTVPRLVALVINMDSLPRSHCMGIGWPVEFQIPLTGAGCKRSRSWGICSGTERSWMPAGFLRMENRKSFSISLKRNGNLNFGPSFGSISKFSGSWMNQNHVDMLFL